MNPSKNKGVTGNHSTFHMPFGSANSLARFPKNGHSNEPNRTTERSTQNVWNVQFNVPLQCWVFKNTMNIQCQLQTGVGLTKKQLKMFFKKNFTVYQFSQTFCILSPNFGNVSSNSVIFRQFRWWLLITSRQ